MSIKRFPNGSRDEETVKNETKTQSKSFLFLFLSKIVCLFVIFSTFFLRWLYHYEIETSLPPQFPPPPPTLFSLHPNLLPLGLLQRLPVYTGRWNPTTNLPHLKKVPGESCGVLYGLLTTPRENNLSLHWLFFLFFWELKPRLQAIMSCQ